MVEAWMDDRMQAWLDVVTGLVDLSKEGTVKDASGQAAIKAAIDFIYERHHPMEPEIDGFKAISCPVCEALLRGPYCHECGQRVLWGGDGHGKDDGA